jgi:glucose-6-phosphate 1-dehydrogenase
MFRIKFLIFIFLTGAVFGTAVSGEERPLSIVIFGATGDLTTQKILPALSNLVQDGCLPEKFSVVGVGRREHSHQDFRKRFKDSEIAKHLFYAQVDFENGSGYEHLEKLLSDIDRDFGKESNRIYFLSTQVRFFAPIVEELSFRSLIADPQDSHCTNHWTRVMIEKPFGHDLESAVTLQNRLALALDASQIYRIDHYLGKEGVQNLLSFRKARKFESLWNRQHIDHVQITMSERAGIGSRARFWEETGLLRDVVQNHLLTVLSLLAIDLLDQDLFAKRAKLLQEIRPIGSNEIVRGQYGPSENMLGYAEEPGVAAGSQVETFAAAKLWIDNDRWRGVPFYIRAGKRLAEPRTEAAVFFKNDPNPLVIRIQPNPAIYWGGKEIHPSIGPQREAYEAIILGCLNGDPNLFVEKEEQFAAWRLLTPILKDWEAHPPQEPFPNYRAGTWGPDAASQLLIEDGRKWRID